MELQLINEVNQQFTPIEQILYNRGISKDEFYHYLNTTDKDINDFKLLGEEKMTEAARTLLSVIKHNDNVIVVIDCDYDGYASAAILINYLHRLFPNWVESHLDYFMHSGKQHGLEDNYKNFLNSKYKLVLLPDAGSNDITAHKELKNSGIDIICLDHHLTDLISEDAIVINNQMSEYPNKELCGAGVTWQFCRFLDSLLSENIANDFIDLVAIALVADMMSLTSFETKHLITKGFKKENIKNPFISYMLDKNNFPLSKTDYVSANLDQACTGIGAAFFIVPFVNAITRTGTLEEKKLIFDSMLEYKAYVKIPEIKRGKDTGKTEPLVLQAVRVIGNVKNRQTKLEDAAMELLSKKVEQENLLQHGILTFLLDSKEVEPNIRGLVANKNMAKYQRPCIVLTKTDHGTYEGSMRGYTKNGLLDFKSLLEKCDGINWVQGHHNAAGVSINSAKIDNFFNDSDKLLSNFPKTPVYRVDYLFNSTLTPKDKTTIIDISNLNDLWGQDFERAYVGVRGLNITKDNIQLLSKDKNPTIRIKLPCGIDVMKFKSSEEEFETLCPTGNGSIKIDLVAKCACNQWGGEVTPQLLIEDYEIVGSNKYYF